MDRKWVIVLAFFLAAVMFVRGWTSLVGKSATFDEWGHLGNGLRFLRHENSRFPLNPTHLINPPLARALAALGTVSWASTAEEAIPLPRKAPRCKAEKKFLERRTEFPFSLDIDSRTLLRNGRLPMLLFSLLGIPLLLWIASMLNRPKAGIWAVLFYTASPNILAHARLITPDMPVAVLCLGATAAWLNMIKRPTVKSMVVAGLILGLALATKYSAGLLIPV